VKTRTLGLAIAGGIALALAIGFLTGAKIESIRTETDRVVARRLRQFCASQAERLRDHASELRHPRQSPHQDIDREAAETLIAQQLGGFDFLLCTDAKIEFMSCDDISSHPVPDPVACRAALAEEAARRFDADAGRRLESDPP
jgi:hypothetical protein